MQKNFTNFIYFTTYWWEKIFLQHITNYFKSDLKDRGIFKSKFKNQNTL